MIISIELENQTCKFDGDKPFDISIPLRFNGAQPNAYGVEKAASQACEAEGIVGDTRRGGSCNFEQIKFIPHCNGTHTECVGHLTRERISVNDCLKDAFVLSALISVEPVNAKQTNEKYSIGLNENDRLITEKILKESLQKIENENLQSLIIRTLPNDKNKLSQTYLEDIPPFFSTEAMQFVREIGVRHLLVDLPSIDRIFDEGKLSNHRIFWNIEEGSFETNEQTLINSTITELIYVPNEIKDGIFFLNLQIPSFVADAAPSRPVIFKIIE